MTKTVRMDAKRRWREALVLLAGVTLVWSGCGAAPPETGSAQSEQASVAAAATTTERAEVVAPSPSVVGPSQVVSAGATIHSANYQMVFTVGYPTQNRDMSKSRNYTLQGGVVGADGRLK